MNTRDVQALDLAVAGGRVDTVGGGLVAELEPERAVFEVVAFHLARCRGRLEDLSGRGLHQELSFALVSHKWREAWAAVSGPDSYPLAILDSETADELYAMGERPEPDPAAPSLDWIAPDDSAALWRRGEAYGDARVMIWATYEPQVKAMASAVRRALRGGHASPGVAVLPLPEAFLPTAFQGVLAPALFPTCKVYPLMPSSTPESDAEEGAEEGAWRCDVRFHWQAPLFVARPRLADFDPRFTIQVPPETP